MICYLQGCKGFPCGFEVFLVLLCNADGGDEEIHTCMSYLAMDKAPGTILVGLLKSMQNCLG